METMTLKQVLQETIAILGGAFFAAEEIPEAVGVQILRARNNLCQCAAAIGDPPEAAAPDPETEERAIREEDL